MRINALIAGAAIALVASAVAAPSAMAWDRFRVQVQTGNPCRYPCLPPPPPEHYFPPTQHGSAPSPQAHSVPIHRCSVSYWDEQTRSWRKDCW
jgi:hypothetical protein